MVEIHNDTVAVFCDGSGHELTLVDVRRKMRWVLDERTLVWADNHSLANRQPLQCVGAEAVGNEAIALTYVADGLPLRVVYTLGEGYVEVRVAEAVRSQDDLLSDRGRLARSGDGEPCADGCRPDVKAFMHLGAGETPAVQAAKEEHCVRTVSLPGGFAPETGPHKLLLPIMQGMLWDGRGPAFDAVRAEGSHFGFSMAFVGTLGDRGGLLVTAETRDDLRWWFGKGPDAGRAGDRPWATPVQIDSLGKLGYEREVRLYVTEPDLVAVAKCYRARVKERGRFISWEEKLAARPGLDRLFGALMTFVGYCQDDLDYAAECAKLKAYGFDRALVYPVRFNAFNPTIVMGGRPAIDIDAVQVAAIKALGYDVAPWSWLNEAMDDGTDRIRSTFRHGEDGEPLQGWAIDAQRWHPVCSSVVPEHQQAELADRGRPLGQARVCSGRKPQRSRSISPT